MPLTMRMRIAETKQLFRSIVVGDRAEAFIAKSVRQCFGRLGFFKSGNGNHTLCSRLPLKLRVSI